LEDQELFDALGREQSLRDLLRDPAARAHLLAALDAPAPAPWFHRWWKPLAAVAVAVALASVAIVAVRRHPPATPQVTVAKLEPKTSAPVATLTPAAPAAFAAQQSAPRSDKTAPAPSRKVAPVTGIRPAAAPPQPPVPAAPPTDAVATDKLKAVDSAGLQTVEVYVVPSQFDPTSRARELQQLQQLRDLPLTPRNAATTGALASANFLDAPADALTLFYGNAPSGLVGGVVAGDAAARGGRGGGGGGGTGAATRSRPMAQAAASAPAGSLGLQYRILRKTPTGDFVEADFASTGAIPAGAIFKLQFTTNDGGYVRVLRETTDGAWPAILNRAVERMQPIETGPIEVDQPGRVKFYLTFARQPLPQSGVAQPDDDIVVDRGRVVTVAGRTAGARQLSFNLTLAVQ
jgi:hypothetical protein